METGIRRIFIINEVRYDSLDNLIKEIDLKFLKNHKFTNNFHGDYNLIIFYIPRANFTTLTGETHLASQ